VSENALDQTAIAEQVELPSPFISLFLLLPQYVRKVYVDVLSA